MNPATCNEKPICSSLLNKCLGRVPAAEKDQMMPALNLQMMAMLLPVVQVEVMQAQGHYHLDKWVCLIRVGL